MRGWRLSHPNVLLMLALAAALAASACIEHKGPVLIDTPKPPVPVPVTPLPSSDKLAWQAQALTAFFHFGVNTFTNKEQSNGSDNPNLFNPTGLKIDQWMATLHDAGFRQAMLTVKHADG